MVVQSPLVGLNRDRSRTRIELPSSAVIRGSMRGVPLSSGECLLGRWGWGGVVWDAAPRCAAVGVGQQHHLASCLFILKSSC